MKLRFALVASILTGGVVVLSLTACLCLVGVEPLGILLLFNFLFLSFMLGLKGRLRRKIGLLALGNAMGLVWNYLLAHMAQFGSRSFGQPFSVFFSIFFPFLNSVWVISFWSWSLSALPRSGLRRTEVHP